MPRPRLVSIVLLAAACGSITYAAEPASEAKPAASPEAPNYEVTTPDLRVDVLDRSDKESFLAVKVDPAGRIFVGGREALFVYEPREDGTYEPRKELVRFPNHTWVYDIALRGEDVYVSTVSALYRIAGAVHGRSGLKPELLIYGVPMGHVHQCFHALTWGPEGDLYFSMGDPVWYYGDFNRPDHWGHWTFFSQPEGTKTPYNGVGGVFRCRPDGSNFQVVARGLRNSCGLVFDRHWNLFTNDNDHESMPAQYVPGRLIHVVPHGYYSWPRGWMPSKTPDRADLLETMTEELGRAVPVGQAYYDDTLLPPAFRNNLLVARWCIRSLTRYPLQANGATFKVHEEHVLDARDDARPVFVAVGRGGRLFVTIAYMAQNETSPVYRSDLVMISPAKDAKNHPFDSYEIVKASPEKLWSELESSEWSRVQAAFEELIRRGGPLLDEALVRLKTLERPAPQAEHLLWLAAAGSKPDGAVIRKAAKADARVALQAMRALAEYPALGLEQRDVTEGLASHDAQVQHAAVLAAFRLPEVLPEIMSGPARSSDTYLRQTATLLMAEKLPVEQLEALCTAKDAKTRLAAVLAVGFRLTLPPATAEIPDSLPLDPLNNVAANTVELFDRKVDLRTLGRVGNFTVAEHWNKSKHTPDQDRLFAALVARLSDTDAPVRLQAAHYLLLLNDKRSEPAVARVIEQSVDERLAATRPLGVPKVWYAGPFPDGDEGLRTEHLPEVGPIDLAAQYPVRDTAAGRAMRAWKQAEAGYFHFSELAGPSVNASYYAYFRLESGSKQRMQLLVGSDDGVRVWQNGRQVFTNDTVRGALPFQDPIALELEPGSNEMLVRVHNQSGESGLYLHYRALQPVSATLPEKLDGASLEERLAAAAKDPASPLAPEFLQTDWGKAARTGDPKRGRALFEAAGCVKCHAIDATAAATGGPSLAGAGRRFTVPYLVESILTPSKQVSPIFRATVLQTKDGLQRTGLVVGETADKLELLQQDTKRVTVAKADIEVRQLSNISPMPTQLIKQPDELKNLLAFLLSSQ